MISDYTIALLKYHEVHHEMSYRRLGELFGITTQRVGQIIKRDKRDRRVVAYLRAHPDASPAQVKVIFHISRQKEQSLRKETYGRQVSEV